MTEPLGRAKPDFRALFEAAPGLYLVLSPDLTIVAASDAYLAATMTRREDIVGRGLFEVFPSNPENSAATGEANLRASLRRVLLHRQPDSMAVQAYDIRRPASEGGTFEQRYWSPVNSPVLGSSGEVDYIIHRVEDVTEYVRLKQQEREHDRTTEDLRTRSGAMEAEIFRRAHELQDSNRRLRELQGELEERVDARTAELLRANEELQRQIAERSRAEEALRRSEEQFRQAQKLEAVGQLAGGIAHDFNNLLSVILGYSQLLIQELDAASPMRADLGEIHHAAERASNLTRQLLAFSRQQVLDPAILDANEVLSDLSRMLARVLGEDIELRIVAGSGRAIVKADRGQLEQVVMNLAVNARDAMPDGGTLTIETDEVWLDDDYVAQHLGSKPGPHLMLAVSDTGIGMDAATQAKAFEPFFTTKPLGKGTGLGLSTVFGIVKQSSGSVFLYSEPGTGTTIKIFLPIAAEQAAPSEAASGRATGGNETILLVEDSDAVRQVVATILRRSGYEVIDQRGPTEALLWCESSSDAVDLLLTDVVMPAMNGRQLAQRLVHRRPRMRVLFMSGYTDDTILHHGVLEAGVPFVQKPIIPDRLLAKVRDVLDTAARG